jgi:hypothetical protein
MSDTITLTLPLDTARLVRDVIERAADDGESRFAENSDGFTVSKAETDGIIADLRRFVAFVEQAFDQREGRKAKHGAVEWLAAEEGRSPTADPVKHVLLIAPGIGSDVSWTFKRAEDGAYNGGNIARGIASAMVAARQFAIDHGYTIVEARSDLPNARAIAAMYEIPFSPLTPDDAPVA